MTTKTRIDNFQGTDSQYIKYLESKVIQLTRPYSPPSSPSSDEGDELTFVPFKPETLCSPATKSRKSTPRWQNEMNSMLGKFPSAADWSSKREFVGLSSEAKLFLAFDTIIGGTIPSTRSRTVESNSLAPSELGHALRLVGAYAKCVAAMNTEKVFTTQIVNFCNLIFVSQCCVLLQHGVEKSQVDDLMEIYIGRSDPKNLDVLRRGAIWVNRMIHALAGDGLGELASEAFVLCGGTVAQYGRFVDAGENGFSHFRQSVLACGYNGSEAHASLPFWIPFFIKTILSDIYSLADICVALGYGESLQIDDYLEWLQIYRSRKVPSPQAVPARYTTTISMDPLGEDSGNPKEVEVSLPKPASKHGRKSTEPDPKRRRLQGPPGGDITFSSIDQPQDNISQPVNHHVRLGEDDAMQALLTAVEHAVSSGHDQQLDGATIASQHEGDERRLALFCGTSIGMWDDRLGEPLDFEEILDTESQLLNGNTDIESSMWNDQSCDASYLGLGVGGALGMWDERLGEALDLEGSLYFEDQSVGDGVLGMWDDRMGEPLDIEGQHVGVATLGE